jgi:hypothetical protein
MNASVNAASAHHNTHYDRRFTGDGIDIFGTNRGITKNPQTK